MLGKPAGEVAKAVARVLALVKLESFADRLPQQLSGGQQQRVALARALAPEPQVLLLDEPLLALDLKLRKEMQSELKRLQTETGITFIFVTHDQEEALTMSNRIGVMSQGALLQVGTPHEIYEHPVNRFVADFIARRISWKDTSTVPAFASAQATCWRCRWRCHWTGSSAQSPLPSGPNRYGLPPQGQASQRRSPMRPIWAPTHTIPWA